MERLRASLTAYQEAPDCRHVDVLDGIRALCVLFVGWFHIWQQSWLAPHFTLLGQRCSLDFLLRSGYLWVDGLLLLSGFLLYLPFTQLGNKPGPPIFPFYQRRLIRILPSYLLCILPLFVLSLIQGKYPSTLDAFKDLGAHLTFTHTLFPFSHHGTHLNGALWTLGVEMQFYFLFPFLARTYRKWPLVTWAAMTGIALAFRAFAAAQADSSMYFNQLPAFLDVYANGFLAASTFSVLRKKLGNGKVDTRIKLLFTVLFVLCVCQLMDLARDQAGVSGYENIRRGQMERRFPLSALLGCAMICAVFSLSGLRFLLGNGLMRILSGISFQFYIYHQLFAVHLKNWGFPPSAAASPWINDPVWQRNYTLCCFAGALVIACLVTYLFERPLARRLMRAKGSP